MHITEYDGIYFIEGCPPEAKVIQKVNTNIHGGLSQAQLKNLTHVKKILADKVRKAEGNCLVNFQYGQKSSFMTTLIGIDNVKWYGSGDIASMELSQIKNLISG